MLVIIKIVIVYTKNILDNKKYGVFVSENKSYMKTVAFAHSGKK